MIPTLLSFILLIVFPLGQLGRLSFLNQQVNIYLYEFVLLLYIAYLIISERLTPITKLRGDARILLLFPIYMILDFVLSIFFYDAQTNGIGFLYLMRLTFYILVFIYFTYAKYKNRLFELKNIFISLGLIILLSFMQYFLYPDLRNIMYLGWDPHLYRIVGTFFDPPIAGAIYGIFLFYVLLEKRISLQLRSVLVGVLGLMIFLTYSRITYIAFFLTMCIWILRKQYIKYIIPFVLIFIAALLLVPKPFGESVNLLRVFSIESRLSNYREAVQVWQKSPLLGVGYNRLRYVRDGYENDKVNFESSHAGASFHSSFLIILATGGIIGVVLFVWMLIYLAGLSEISRYFILFVSIASITDNVLLHPFVLFVLFLFISREKVKNPLNTSL